MMFPSWRQGLYLFLSLVAGPLYAQTQDTLRHYTLGEIVVGSDSVARERHHVATSQRVGLAAIAQSDAASIDRVLRNIPSAHLQTNSRGETLVYLRGAGERQVAVFFDGAQLNVPWDNRVDLSLVPAEVVGEIAVVKGPPPVIYGTNVMGGALNLTSRNLDRDGRHGYVSGIIGSHGAMQVRGQYMLRHGRFGFAAFSAYSQRSGVGVPGSAVLPYSQDGSGLRTNTHRSLVSGYGQATYYAEGGARVGVSVLALQGEKGIAPEGHNDPAVSRVRYWRYPSWHSVFLIFSSVVPIGSSGVTFRGTGWTNRFGQTIHQYQSADYVLADKTQEDRDNTQGIRLSLYAPLGPGAVTGAVSLLSSTHRQVDDHIDQTLSLDRTFQQHVYSMGAEYVRPGRISFTAGVSLDGLATPQTGDKPSRRPQQTYSVMAGLSGEVQPGVRARISAGRKVRFPTMRELFGEALGRFLVNPALVPEHALLTEAGVSFDREGLSAEVVAFFNRTYDTIDQRLAHVPGEEKPFRQRVNLSGSRVLGMESIVRARVARGLTMECNVTTMYARGFSELGGQARLTEKPSTLGKCISAYKNPRGFSVLAEYIMTGEAYGLRDTGSLARLPSSHVFNARLSYLMIFSRQWAAEAFARVNNATDSVMLPQLGLPGPGREFHVGMQLSF